METALLVIDGIIASKPGRWALMLLAVVACLFAFWCRGQLGVVRLQRDAAQGQSATYRAHLDIQNAAIIKQGDDMERLLKQLQAATADVEKEREKLKKRQIEVREVILQGPCPDMVQRVLDEVRK